MPMQVNTDTVQLLLQRHETLRSDRMLHEHLWRECERWVDPYQQGGFYRETQGRQRDAHITDSTAQMGLDAFVAAAQAMLIPDGEDVTLLETTDSALNDRPEVQVWLKQASDRLHACRNRPDAGFEAHSSQRWRSLGVYGNQGFWTDEIVGQQLFYASIHLSECFIDQDFKGAPDTYHRRVMKKSRALRQMFHDDMLPDAVLSDEKGEKEFTLVHIVRPNALYEPGRIDAGRFKIQSLYLIEEEKALVSVRGYNSSPLSMSRYVLPPNSVYGVGPAASVLGTIKMVNAMQRDVIKAAHLAVDPPVLGPSDGVVTRQSMRPGAYVAGGMEGGRRQYEPYQNGANLPFTMQDLPMHQEAIKQAFLVHVFAILNAPIDRQTATEYLGRKREAMLLQAPNIGRQIAEALVPQVARELDLLLRASQLPLPPATLLEARAGLRFTFDNPLTRAAKSTDAHNFLGGVQALEPIAQVDPSVFDVIDMDAAPRGLMLALGVPATWLASPDAVMAKRQQREQSHATDQLASGAPAITQAALNIAKARSLPVAPGVA